jgi:hypothetical protein
MPELYRRPVEELAYDYPVSRCQIGERVRNANQSNSYMIPSISRILRPDSVVTACIKCGGVSNVAAYNVRSLKVLGANFVLCKLFYMFSAFDLLRQILHQLFEV